MFLPGESQGWGSLVGCCLWGRAAVCGVAQSRTRLKRLSSSSPHLKALEFDLPFPRSHYFFIQLFLFFILCFELQILYWFHETVYCTVLKIFLFEVDFWGRWEGIRFTHYNHRYVSANNFLSIKIFLYLQC